MATDVRFLLVKPIGKLHYRGRCVTTRFAAAAGPPGESIMSGIRDLIVIGDRVLIRPIDEDDRTQHGLYLPAGVRSKEKVQGGRIVKVGPGYPIPNPTFDDSEPWATDEKEPVRYVPLQAQSGDYALFLREKAIEIEYEGDKMLIVPQASLLVLVRRDPLEELTSGPDSGQEPGQSDE